MKSHTAVIAALLFSVPSLARGDTLDYEPTTALAEEEGVLLTGASGSVRSKSQGWMVAPSGTYVVGAKLRLLQSDRTPWGDTRASVSDLALFEVLGRASLGDRLELGFGSSVLAKEMTGSDESTFQGGYLNLRVGLASWAALDLGATARPMIGDLGWSVAPGAVLSLRKSVHRHMRFAGGIGFNWTSLLFDDDTRTGFGEVGLRGQIVFPMRNAFAAWLGSDYRIPVSDPADTMFNLDPEPRLGVHAGWAFTFVDDWNIYAEYSVIDRGDLADMGTTVPVIDGGFDQTQIIFGVSRRFHDTDPGALSQ